MEPPLPFDQVAHDSIASERHTRPHNVPPEMLGYIMSFVRDNDLIACVRTNSSFYLAAKPYVYRQVSLDQYFHVFGAEHPLLDLDMPATSNTRRRPLFRRSWMTRACRILEVASHHESFCAAIESDSRQPLIPRLPHLRTLHLPFDVHGTLASGHEPTPCGIHSLKPWRLIQHKVYWTSRKPATTTVEGVRSYTANIAARAMLNHDDRPLDLQLPIMAPGARLTLIAPHTIYGSNLPAPCLSFQDPRGLLTIPQDLSAADRVQVYSEMCTAGNCPHQLMLKLARTVCRFMEGPRIRLIGFDIVSANNPFPAYRHLAWLTRALLEANAETAILQGTPSEANLWRARAGPVDAFHLINARWWNSHRVVELTTWRPAQLLVVIWDMFGWPRPMTRVAGYGQYQSLGITWTREVKFEGEVGPFWVPEPEPEWCLAEE
ncbi:hypothetical protein CspeluHIS016_0406640 [Cutaneotrichosporon spelunceum]|uniref:F-box domain-containing protein n=1 Tax=Cutaneotrichosporon spelunceum TaxID=1672016 RepID=A0AAD3YC79_9TREE|nr:hypothetical protein CspeluHIS016_0406640 [Cutaneotrichosporon spelunceum]